MTCQLWVRGRAESAGYVDVDVLLSAWVNGRPFPTLTVLGTGNFGRGVYTTYSANPAWQYNAAGWYTYPQFYTKNCGSLDPTVAHDCINGGCIPSTTYNTPGIFANLAACQSGCAKNSNCVGECVSAAQIAALQAATSNLISRYCK